ncbi:hypothetical protein ACLMJK_003918 [Lecanora helva]
MSEYWKSTPKYWCKHCSTFVKDTKLEKTNHEASPKHQGHLKRFLRDLHKGHEREEREKQRAKDEVDRLNEVKPGSASKATGVPWERKPAIPATSSLRQATPADRKKQLAQLAELGVAVPEDFRKEMAMVGDWQTTSERVIYESVKKEEENEIVKPEGLNVGVRKRKFAGQEEEEEAGETVVKKGWGSTIRNYPDTTGDGVDDLDALLNAAKNGKNLANGSQISPKTAQADQQTTEESSSTSHVPRLKHEESSNPGIPDIISTDGAAEPPKTIKQEDLPAEPEVLFKKRKAKPIRQK